MFADREIPVNYDELIGKLKGIDLIVFVGGISPRLEGEEMPIQIPGFKGGDQTDIELPMSSTGFSETAPFGHLRYSSIYF